MLWDREMYLSHMRHEFTGKEMLTELFGPLSALEREWRAQGVAEDEINLSAFGLDAVKKIDLPIRLGIDSPLQPVVLEDTPEYQIKKDAYGRTTKLIKATASIALPLSYPVETMEDWLAIKPYYTYSDRRIDWEALHRAKALYDEGYLSIAYIPGAFSEPRELLGDEALCIAYYEEPEMIQDMLDTFASTALRVLEQVRTVLPIDVLSIHEDMAGKSGPLVGPSQIHTFFKPYYRRIWDEMRLQGSSLFSQDSDGNIVPILDALLECGLTSIYPCEPMAGMDIVALRKQYGNKLTYKGGLDKHALRGTQQDILRELEYKLQDATRGGGVIFALDHRIPNGVPIENYRYYLKTAREMLGLPTNPAPAPFVRMAF